MDKRLQEMLDHYEIRKTLAEYCHGCDRVDSKLMASVYTGADSFDDHGLVQAPGPDYTRAMIGIIQERTEVVSHILGQTLIKVEGDVGAAETFFLTQIRSIGADGQPRLSQQAGRFVDRLVRTEGKWRIKHRIAVNDVSITLKIEEDELAASNMKTGTRDASDPGASLLKLAHHG
jgi:hypothetical protein